MQISRDKCDRTHLMRENCTPGSEGGDGDCRFLPLSFGHLTTFAPDAWMSEARRTTADAPRLCARPCHELAFIDDHASEHTCYTSNLREAAVRETARKRRKQFSTICETSLS